LSAPARLPENRFTKLFSPLSLPLSGFSGKKINHGNVVGKLTALLWLSLFLAFFFPDFFGHPEKKIIHFHPVVDFL
jgi:hypothetical protein